MLTITVTMSNPPAELTTLEMMNSLTEAVARGTAEKVRALRVFEDADTCFDGIEGSAAGREDLLGGASGVDARGDGTGKLCIVRSPASAAVDDDCG